jgi:hypothetical protein
MEKENPPKIKFIYFLLKIGFFFTIIPTTAFAVSNWIFGTFNIGATIFLFFMWAFIGYLLSWKTWDKQNNI